MPQYDIVIAGLGAMGSSAAYQLGRRGLKVLGLDQFHPPHTLGSTHGRTRIIREAYFEHPLYVPLVRRAYELWDELSERLKVVVYRKTGGLMLGPADGTVVPGSRASAVAHAIPHENLTSDEVRRRFPGLTPPEDFVALYEDRAGLLFPETIVQAYLDLALEHGVDLRLGCPVLDWRKDGSGILVRTGMGDFRAGKLVLAVGPWIGRLYAGGANLFQIERQLFHWFDPVPEAVQWPVSLWEHHPGGLFAALPDAASGLKVGVHHGGQMVDPDQVSRESKEEEELAVRALLAEYLPVANTRLLGSSVCLYTNSADGHFVIDWHPEASNVLIVSPCSGHGFKFASTIGEIVADLVAGDGTSFDLAPFSLSRFE